MSQDYKSTGFRSPQLVANLQTNGDIIAAPGEGRHIVITDALNCKSGEGSNIVYHTSAIDDNILFFIPDEAVINFVSPIRAPENTKILVVGVLHHVTLCYYIEDTRTGV